MARCPRGQPTSACHPIRSQAVAVSMPAGAGKTPRPPYSLMQLTGLRVSTSSPTSAQVCRHASTAPSPRRAPRTPRRCRLAATVRCSNRPASGCRPGAHGADGGASCHGERGSDGSTHEKSTRLPARDGVARHHGHRPRHDRSSFGGPRDAVLRVAHDREGFVGEELLEPLVRRHWPPRSALVVERVTCCKCPVRRRSYTDDTTSSSALRRRRRLRRGGGRSPRPRRPHADPPGPHRGRPG